MSIFGIGGGSDCSSTLLSAAFVVGDGTAHANGLFGAAIAVGSGSSATTGNAFTLATALGSNATATAGGLFGAATQVGDNGSATTDGSGVLGNLGFNFALNITRGATEPGSSSVLAAGIANVATAHNAARSLAAFAEQLKFFSDTVIREAAERIGEAVGSTGA